MVRIPGMTSGDVFGCGLGLESDAVVRFPAAHQTHLHTQLVATTG